MKNTKNYDFIYALLTLAFFAFGCSFGNIKAEENTSNNHSQTEYKTEENQAFPNQNFDASSIVGTYDYDTEKDGEGYDKSLEVTKANDGKLFINISGSYIYKIGETQSMHEAEGKGDAALKGNRADATLVDETGKPCRATIIFKNKTADVKVPETCQFNVDLGGVYKKVGSENKPTKAKTNNKKSGLSETHYDKMMDFINDFDAHNVGEEFIITSAPTELIYVKTPADKFGNQSYKGLFYLEGVTEDDTPSYSVLTSKAMLESIKSEMEDEPVILRLTATIVEFKGKFDVYRTPFVTKIEGFDSEGDVIWTAVGDKAAKLNFIH